MPLNAFLGTLYTIENIISSKLMQQGGFTKLIFQSGGGRWFTLSKHGEDQFSYQYIGHGLWNYFDSIFEEKSILYAGSRILEDRDLEFESYLSRLRSGLNICSKALGPEIGKSFEELLSTKTQWSLFAIPFDNQKENLTVKSLFKAHANRKGFNLMKLYQYCVTKFMVVSMVVTHENSLQKSTQAPSK